MGLSTEKGDESLSSPNSKYIAGMIDQVSKLKTDHSSRVKSSAPQSDPSRDQIIAEAREIYLQKLAASPDKNAAKSYADLNNEVDRLKILADAKSHYRLTSSELDK